jgi:hypothetical protein
MSTVERTIRLATIVSDLTDAWVFIMEHLDEVGPDPSIEISPMWVVTAESDDTPRKFEVCLSGMIPEVMTIDA